MGFCLAHGARRSRAARNKIGERTTLRELDEADQLALRLAAAVAHRENASEEVTAATDIRQRIYTLALRHKQFTQHTGGPGYCAVWIEYAATCCNIGGGKVQ